MKTLQKILGIGALTLALDGCSEFATRRSATVDIFGKPLSVAYEPFHSSRFVAVINAETCYGKNIMLKGNNYRNFLETVALIQSEINDRDDEYVYFRGYFNENDDENGRDLNNYVITSVSANGIDVNLEE